MNNNEQVAKEMNCRLEALRRAEQTVKDLEGGAEEFTSPAEDIVDRAIKICNRVSQDVYAEEVREAAEAETEAPMPLAFARTGVVFISGGICYYGGNFFGPNQRPRAERIWQRAFPEIIASARHILSLRRDDYESYRRAVVCGVAVPPAEEASKGGNSND